ncbi:MAG: peptidylprolyl isomerase [Lachnospiraceae bacterium]|nr:peptidylprolyl isomerase [Lachnospiraceae bacterium]
MKKVKILKMMAALLSSAMMMTACGGEGSAPVAATGSDPEPAASETAAEPAATEAAEATESTAEAEPAEGGLHHVTITVKDYGTIELELDAEAAPITVQNFLDLAGQGFYDGLTFHRIISGFMIQGGDPLGNGTGGSDKEIVGEFSENGYENNISHKRGVISMARSMDPNSASSQFFIVHADADFLDGQYAGFGHVTSGMEVVDKICEDARPIDNNGTIPKDKQPVIESVKVID